MTQQKQFGFIFFAIMLAMVNLLTSDIYVSAFPEIKKSFATTEMLVGWSLSIFSIGSIFSVPLYGPLSDKFGRKPVLMVGLVIFAFGSFGCFFSANIETFLVFRFIQATGVCSAYVLWQPMVVDTYNTRDIQKIFALVMSFLGISPALGPLLGGMLTEHFGWHSIFIFLLIMTAVLILWTLFVFKESLCINNKSTNMNILSSYAVLLKSKIFQAMAISLGLCIGLYMSYLTLTPFTLAALGLSPIFIGLTFIPTATAFGIGGIAAKYLHSKYSKLTIVKIGVVGTIAGTCILITAMNAIPLTSSMQIFIPFMVTSLFIGIALPTGTSLVMELHSDISGTCSSGMSIVSSLLTFSVTAISATLQTFYGINAIGIVTAFSSVLAFIILVLLTSPS